MNNQDKQTPSAEQQVMVDALAAALFQAAQQQAKPQEAADAQGDGRTVDLGELFSFVASKLLWIMLAAVMGAALLGCHAGLSVPVYTATSKLYIVGSQGTPLNTADLQLGSMLKTDYEEVFKTREVHETVRRKMNLSFSHQQLQNMLLISSPENTRVLYISVRNADAHLAADLANAYAEAAQEFIVETMEAEKPILFSAAQAPEEGEAPDMPLQILLGFLLGAVLAGGVLTLRFVLKGRSRMSEDALYKRKSNDKAHENA